MAKTNKQAQRKPSTTALAVLESDAAGVDIGATEHWVAVAPDRDEQPVRKFGTFTADLYAIADWLALCQVKVVAMESTGVYWIPLFEILVERGFEVDLVDARHTKNVSGRKSDVSDCEWIRQLRSYGLLRKAFIPAADMAAIRSYVRHRQTLIQFAAMHVQHMQKALMLMNLQLHHVISDITGVTGMRILKAILQGERDPQRLAQMKDSHIKNSVDTIARALEGHYRPEHLLALRHALELYETYQCKIGDCDDQIQQYLGTMQSKVDPQTLPARSSKRKRKPQRNEPRYDCRREMYRITGADLTRIDGIDAAAAQIIISEIGRDMSPWKTEKHFAAWATLAPNHQISGGKILRRRPKRSANRFVIVLRMCAQSLLHSKSALGAYCRRICSRIGMPKGLTATAHKLARLIYRILKYGVPYVDIGQQQYEQKYREQLLKNLRRKAADLGFALVDRSALLPSPDSLPSVS